jgi:hypothetical protein
VQPGKQRPLKFAKDDGKQRRLSLEVFHYGADEGDVRYAGADAAGDVGEDVIANDEHERTLIG